MVLLYFPLVIFLLAFFFVYKRNGLDLAAFILLSYSATSLASVFLARTNIAYDESQLSLTPVLLHCFFTLALTYPFMRFNSNKKRLILPIKNVRLFNTVCISFIFLFIVELLATFPIIFSRLTASSSELESIRIAAYQGEIVVSYSFGVLPHFVDTIMNIMSAGSMCVLVLFFYSLCFLKKSKVFNVLLLISSMSALIYSIITVDRSKFFFWLLLFLFSYFIFKPYLPKRQKKFLYSIMIPLCALFLGYFLIVTIARFGESDMGAEGSILSYAGQPLFNLCSLWDLLPGTTYNFEGVFPLTYYVFDRLFDIQLKFGVSVYDTFYVSDLNGFNALLGYGVREVGQPLTILLLLLLSIIMYNRVGHYSKMTSLSLNGVMWVFLLGTIVICGFISYYYSSWPHILMFWFFILVSKRMYN